MRKRIAEIFNLVIMVFTFVSSPFVAYLTVTDYMHGNYGMALFGLVAFIAGLLCIRIFVKEIRAELKKTAAPQPDETTAA